MRLATRRFLLREFTDVDLPAMRTAYADPRLAQSHGAAAPAADTLHRRFVEWSAARPRANYQLAIATHDAPAALCGSAGIRTDGHPPGQGELGIELWPHLWGRHAVAVELLDALLGFAFRQLGLAWLKSETAVSNDRALRLMRHYGAVPLRVSACPDESFGVHVVRFGLERSAWDRRPRKYSLR